MAERGIRTQDSAGIRRLGAAGRDVVAAREQIASILRNRIGPEAAALFAAPTPDDGGHVWRAVDGTPLKPLGALPPAEAARLRERHREIAGRVEALAQRIAGEGDAGRIAGHMMRLALVTPDGFEALHAAGDQPVLVNWGHAAEGQAVPVLEPAAGKAMAAPAGTGTAAADVAPLPEADTAADDETDSPGRRPARTGGFGWLAWALPGLLLVALGALIWLLMQPVEPVLVQRDRPAPPPVDPVPAARDRLAAIEAELARVEAMRDEVIGLCEPLPQERTQLPPPEPEPQSGPDPDVAVVEPPKPEPEPEPEPRPEPPVAEAEPQPAPRPRVELPPEVPPAAELPPRVAQLPETTRPAPTLCEPGWTPSQRPEVMVVIDGSGSMQDSFAGAPSRIEAAKDSIGDVVTSLHKDIKTGLVSFTDCGETSTPQKYGYSQRPELLSRVRGVSPSRGTSLANSIRRAGNAAKSVGPATVVVVSDGEDTCGGDPCAAARALKAQKPMLKINVIDLSGGRSAVLQCVAGATGGRVFTPRNAAQMTEEMQEATGQPDASACNP
ncbi:VWA domain-containing protein [Minwuia thermotolerans]|uniref:VWFA domain-containing protein n=1 Tax=Minwuia thermotolerans TaxID=2056226 RepID=A0A2M9FWA3_9PROT|nr:VWA domain-containing protein [Minwuia thermotolerans]PJK27723.1 hypothetical protein CVT23_20755 [Minwuia thermotolerans]